MAKATTKQAGKAKSADTPLTGAMQAWQDVMTEYNRFVMDRLHQDLDTQQAMLQCKTPTELLQLQSDFFKTAVTQYSEESTRLMRMMTEATGKSVEEAQSSIKRGYDDVPL